MKLFLVRHGETDWNVKSLYQGQTDVPLNENGKRQAEDLALKMKNYPLDAIFSSDLKRACETAEIINAYHNLKLQKSPLVREKCFGEMEGKLKKEVLKAHPKYFLPEGGVDLSYTLPGGESWDEVWDRVKKFFDNLKKQDFENVLIVTHGGVMRTFSRHFKGLSEERMRSMGKITNCQVWEEEI